MALGNYSVQEDADLGITLSDGTRLSARVWMPEGVSGPLPAILEYLPYRKRDGTAARDALTHPWFASHGYGCLRVDIRGNGESEGVMTDEYSEQELTDAEEVLAWIVTQPWSNGAVGMMGISWGGFNALQVAARRPPALKAIVTLCSSIDRFGEDIHYKGGCLLNENLGWAATMLSYSSRPPDPALVGDKWRAMWMERLEAEPHLAETWLAHQSRDAYWQHGSVSEDFGAIEAATLAIGGWGDAYKNAVPDLVRNLNAPVKGIIGPWIHKYPHFAPPEPRIGFLDEALRWWDHWLKGEDRGVEEDPPLRLYLMDGVRPKTWYAERPGRWVAQDPESSKTLDLHLASTGLREEPEDIALPLDSPADCGLMAGEYCAIWLGPDLPGDQRRDDALSATFDGEPLTEPLDIVGAPVVDLTVVPASEYGQIAVRLCDLAPDGASTRITYGVLNLTHRAGSGAPQPLPIGEPVNLRVKLDHIAYRVPTGHRLRVAISTAYWPLLWPAPEKTSLTLSRGSVSLPLLDELSSAPVTFAPPDAAPEWAVTELRPSRHARQVVLDQATGVTTVVIEDDFGERRDDDHGLATGSTARESWTIHPDDPLSAYGETAWSQTLSRGDWRVRTETSSSMSSDAEAFHLTAEIKAYEGDALVFEKTLKTSVPRKYL